MRSCGLDLESQGQGHTKVTKVNTCQSLTNVTRVKGLQKMRFSPDCEHAECRAIYHRLIAIFKFSTLPIFP